MKLIDFHYDLPESLIAHYPAPERSASRLLCLSRETGGIQHRSFHQLLDYLKPSDLLVFNNTRVIPARLFGQKPTGGRVEILVERILSEHTALAHVKSSKTPKAGARISLAPGFDVEVEGRENDLFLLRFHSELSVLQVLENLGHMPLPPYIKRPDESFDQARYQTVYAKIKGSVAAPTAGLHFDEALLNQLRECHIETAEVTLHVGAGTFQNIRVENITEHKMHSEWLEVSESVCEKVRKTQKVGGRVIAVGTTSVRSLETASQEGVIKPYCGETSIFIYPGYQFQCVDAMITNFHLPQSSLLMLVSAFAGQEVIMKAYQEAINQEYRFFSYGDAMFVF